MFSISPVYEELQEKEDDLSQWARQHRRGFFLLHDEKVTTARNQVADWAEANYPKKAFDKFTDGADPWLVAYARVHEHIVVTYETRIPNAERRWIKIPNACDRFGIASMDPNTMLRNEGAGFRV